MCLQADVRAVIGGQAIVDAVGEVDATAVGADIQDITPKCAISDAEAAEARVAASEDDSPAKEQQLALVSRSCNTCSV